MSLRLKKVGMVYTVCKQIIWLLLLVSAVRWCLPQHVCSKQTEVVFNGEAFECFRVSCV